MARITAAPADKAAATAPVADGRTKEKENGKENGKDRMRNVPAGMKQGRITVAIRELLSPILELPAAVRAQTAIKNLW